MLKNYYFYNKRPQALASQGYTHCEVKTTTGPCVDKKATLVSLNPNCCEAIDFIFKKYRKTTRKNVRDIDACFMIFYNTCMQHFYALR